MQSVTSAHNQLSIYHKNFITHLCQKSQLQLVNASKGRLVDDILIPAHYLQYDTASTITGNCSKLASMQ